MSEPCSLVLRTGQKVLIDGRKAEAGNFVDDGRVFLFHETGGTIVYSNVAQVRMAREGRLTTQASMNALSAGIREALDTDLDAFAPEVLDKMLWRRRFVQAVEDLPARDRHKKAKIKPAIEKQQEAETATRNAAVEDAARLGETCPALRDAPSVRMVKSWRAAFLAAGRDVRALADLSYRKGRGDQLPGWIREEIHKAIDAIYATQPPGTYAEARRRANTAIRARAEREGRPLPMLGKGEPVGVNVIQRVVASDYEVYDILLRRLGKAEADRIMEAVGNGPQGNYPLQQVEADHTHLDILVVDQTTRGILGRPWLTVLIDRYSRCIVGFALSFHPPSWTTVMEALRIGVSDKGEILKDLGGIDGPWDCFGAPDELYCDNGREFHSASMQATEAALNMRICYLPRKKGWLKGKIERWFGTLEREVVHTLPGTTMSNVMERKQYDAEAGAVLTLKETLWIVTKWIVDVYHQDDRDGRREAPAMRWARGMREFGAKPPPPRELLVPLTGLTFSAQLTREGIKAKCLRWNSNAFSALRNRIGESATVLARIDPLDLQHAYVLDPERAKWVEGDLKSEDVEAGLTLHQYEVVRAHARKTRQIGEDQRAALARARGEIFEFVKEITDGVRKSKAPKRMARFMTEGRKPHEHIAPTRCDPVASAGPMGSHRVGASRPQKAQQVPHLMPPAPGATSGGAAQTPSEADEGPRAVAPLPTVRRRIQ